MSYPAPRYVAATGEASTWLRPASTSADLPRANGAAHYLATGVQTGGRFGLYRWDMGPDAQGPGPHFHRTMSESFFVLSGTVRIYDGERWADTGPGDFAYAPEGGIHGFRNESGADASMLILFAPGAPREAYFEGLVALAEGRWSPTQEELDAFYLEHDNHWL
jgi:mannose-6-phosphate isomerase-like protein (cupin superfamily)